jgi:phenylacetic acid degradation protein paaN
MTEAQTHSLFDKHLATLRKAVAAAEHRTRWNPYPESSAQFGGAALAAGREAFDAYRDASFYLDQPGVIGRVGGERSPYGLPLNINYPQCGVDALITAARNGMQSWVAAGAETRVGICLEILDRIHSHGIEIAHAVMHTTGQPFGFAYQYSLAGALNRGLEAIASAYREMKQVPDLTLQEKLQGKAPPIAVESRYVIVPRGVALTLGSPTEPTSAAWPGIFASLATGNPVLVQPHPASILPLALTVAVARTVIKEAGFDPNLVSLLADDAGETSISVAGLRPEVRIIDCAASSATANWLEENAHQAAIFSLKSGANCVVVDSTSDYKGMLRNLMFSLCLYSGQLASTPRLILISREGVRTANGVVPPDQFSRDLAFAIGKLIENPAQAVDILGAMHPHWPAALIATPLLLNKKLDEDNRFVESFNGQWDPVTLVIETATTTEALTRAERFMRDHGALNFSVYTTSAPLQQLAEDIAARAGVALNINFTGKFLLSQTDAFSDFYATGENPASTCSLVDAAFVARRFFVLQTRTQIN